MTKPQDTKQATGARESVSERSELLNLPNIRSRAEGAREALGQFEMREIDLPALAGKLMESAVHVPALCDAYERAEARAVMLEGALRGLLSANGQSSGGRGKEARFSIFWTNEEGARQGQEAYAAAHAALTSVGCSVGSASLSPSRDDSAVVAGALGADIAQALQAFVDEREPQIFLMPNECEAITEWFAALTHPAVLLEGSGGVAELLTELRDHYVQGVIDTAEAPGLTCAQCRVPPEIEAGARADRDRINAALTGEPK